MCVCVCGFLRLGRVQCLSHVLLLLVQPPVLTVTWSASSHIDYLTTGLDIAMSLIRDLLWKLTGHRRMRVCVCVCVKGESRLSELSD